MDKTKIGALCKREFDGPNSGSFTRGVLYPAEINKNSTGIIVINNNDEELLLDIKDFKSHFERQELALPPEMKKDDSAHWKEVMGLAEKYGLIVQAYGGTATLISRSVQLTELGLQEFLRIQAMNGIARSALGYPFDGKPQDENAEAKGTT